MALFEQPLNEILAYINEKSTNGLARDFSFTPVIPVADSTQVILSDDAGLELGKPPGASLSLLLWDDGSAVTDGRITLVGPDFAETDLSSLPFGQVIVAGGDFSEEYDCYRDLREAIYHLRLRGFMTRLLPDRQRIWCRIGKEALASGFNAQVLGSALIQSMKKLPFISAVQVLFITSNKAGVEELAGPANTIRGIVEAMIKMYEETNFDCDACDYVEVCDSVVELREMRERLRTQGGDETERGDGDEG